MASRFHVSAAVGRRPWRWALAVLSLIAVASMLLAARQASRGSVPVSVATGGDWIGHAAPDFVLDTLDGRRLRLSDLRGRVVLINFWATWCAPCALEMPWLAELDARYRSRGLTILGVSVDDASRERIAKMVEERRATYPILLKDDAVELQYGGVRFLPQTFFVGRDGRVVMWRYGIRTREAFEADIRSALGL